MRPSHSNAISERGREREVESTIMHRTVAQRSPVYTPVLVSQSTQALPLGVIPEISIKNRLNFICKNLIECFPISINTINRLSESASKQNCLETLSKEWQILKIPVQLYRGRNKVK